MSNKLITDAMNYYIGVYQKEIIQADSNEKKLSCIATLIHELELLHPFTDGNCRTFVFALLPKLLIEQGFTPVILENPNRFDLFSNQELVEEIKKGLVQFKNYKNQPNLSNLPNPFEPIFYINNTTALLFAHECVKQQGNWGKIGVADQSKAIEIIQHSLMNIQNKEISYHQMQRLNDTIHSILTKSIYKPHAQAGFFGKKSEYTIDFGNVFRNILGYHSEMSVNHITTELESTFSTQHQVYPQ